MAKKEFDVQITLHLRGVNRMSGALEKAWCGRSTETGWSEYEESLYEQIDGNLLRIYAKLRGIALLKEMHPFKVILDWGE
jgi:hypothetical protein